MTAADNRLSMFERSLLKYSSF